MESVLYDLEDENDIDFVLHLLSGSVRLDGRLQASRVSDVSSAVFGLHFQGRSRTYLKWAQLHEGIVTDIPMTPELTTSLFLQEHKASFVQFTCFTQDIGSMRNLLQFWVADHHFTGQFTCRPVLPRGRGRRSASLWCTFRLGGETTSTTFRMSWQKSCAKRAHKIIAGCKKGGLERITKGG